MIRYIKCPRCELNYIDAEKQEFCDVCLKELKGIPSDMDDMEEEEELATELCPVCGENMMRPGEKMCEACRKKSEYEDEPDAIDEEDDEWREYLDDDTDTDLDNEMGDIGETFDEDEEPEEEEEYENQDEDEDLEYVTGDEIYSLAGDDEDDDEDEDEDDDF